MSPSVCAGPGFSSLCDPPHTNIVMFDSKRTTVAVNNITKHLLAPLCPTTFVGLVELALFEHFDAQQVDRLLDQGYV